ncbi:hypothetical protein ET445_02730 [Agromyces protaetiae]|uniref:Uncharacterized protein n=1 Tax=Agromyces protaetiae TaxID=2509455 RepID=A0A4P6F9X5_9MICO|nr:hypothetical protein [Agromyces protaetiae]QAY72415.1 hypothetical protein ET445_02730 [Agromyces protaetiae]
MSNRDVDRIARLQRAAYGAGADSAARAAAVAELEALLAVPVEEPTGEGPTGEGEARLTALPAADAADAADAAATADPPEAADAPAGVVGFLRRNRTAVISAAAALAVGLTIGWGLGASGTPTERLGGDDPGASDATDADVPEPEPFTNSYTGALPPVPVASTGAVGVFTRPQEPDDVPTHMADGSSGEAGFDLETASTRLIGERADGVKVYAAREENGVDICVLLAAGQLLAKTCTEFGQFNGSGLLVEGTYEEPYGTVGVLWRPDGTLAWAAIVGE